MIGGDFWRDLRDIFGFRMKFQARCTLQILLRIEFTWFYRGIKFPYLTRAVYFVW